MHEQRSPSSGDGLREFGRIQFFIRTDDRGYIEVGDQCRTSAEGVWAVSAYGSCTLKPTVGLVISWLIV